MDTCPDCGKEHCVCPYIEYLNTFEARWENYRLALGWRCPNCGKGLAPDVKECSCVDEKGLSKLAWEGKLRAYSPWQSEA